jgi:enoyl-CoA hydratase/carnithine racemase
MISVEHHDTVAVVRLARDVTNALNLRFVQILSQTLERLKNHADTCSLVLASTNDKFFSIGFDIPHLFELSEEEFRTYYQAYNRVCLDLYTLPKPTVAAITGHAIAGACILTLCCDYRFIAEGRKLMGLNEVKLGVPVPFPGDRILHHLVGARHAREIMEMGEFYPSEGLLQMGVVDQMLPLEQVVPTAVEKAGALGALPQEAFATIKCNRVQPVEAQILAKLEEKERLFVEHWYTDETRARLKEAMAKY